MLASSNTKAYKHVVKESKSTQPGVITKKRRTCKGKHKFQRNVQINYELQHNRKLQTTTSSTKLLQYFKQLISTPKSRQNVNDINN